MNFAVLPAEHAMYEWNIYVPAYGEVIQSLIFSPLGDHRAEGCAQLGFDPDARLNVRRTLHQRLAEHGVRSIQFTLGDYAASSYSKLALAGAEVVPHRFLSEAFVQLREAVETVDGKALLSFYWASIDSVAHQYGPGSRFHAAEIASFWSTFDALLGGLDRPGTLFLFIADHDQVAARREDTIYINERLPELADCLPLSHTGKTIYPNGSPRDLFLHLKPERRGEVLQKLRDNFGDIAEVLPMEEAIGLELFGPRPVSPELRRRLGDVLVLPHDGQFIGWREPGLLENRFNGHHGGLAAAELITAFGAVDRL
jgi:hypothetical protein